MAVKPNGDGDETVRDLAISNVTPLSLGIQLKGEVMSVVLPGNTPIPTTKARNYETSDDNQSSLSIKVYQGERTKSTDNYLLGEFIVPGIPIAPKGVEKIEACFEIDANGILKVRVKVLSTGTIEKITIADINGRRSREEIDKMIEDAKKYTSEDEEYKRKADAYKNFGDYIFLVKRKVKDLSMRRKLSKSVLANAGNVIAEASKWLKENRAASVDEFEYKKKELENTCRAIGIFENKNQVSSFRRNLSAFARYIKKVVFA